MAAGPEVTIFAVFLVSLWATKDLAHPATLQPLVWTLALWSLSISRESFYPVQESVRYIFVVSSISFSTGSLLLSRPLVDSRNSPPLAFSKVRDLSIPTIAVTCYSLALINAAAPISLSFQYFEELRAALSENDGALFGIPGTASLLIGCYIVAIASVGASKPHQLPIALACWLTLSIILLSKFNFLLVISASIFAAKYRGTLKGRQILLASGLLVGLFFLITLLRHSEETSNEDFILDFLRVYISSPIPAFSETTALVEPRFFGYTFRVPSLWLNRLGAEIPVHQLIQEFVFTPLPTNVFTYLHPYYLEMGITGATAIPFLLGSVHGHIHHQAASGSVRARFLSALLMYPLLMQFFVEQYLLWLTNWIYISALSLLLIARARKQESGTFHTLGRPL